MLNGHENIYEFELEGRKYIITKSKLLRDGRVITTISDGREFHVHLKDSYQNNICTLSTCSHYCIIKNGTYKCGCPEDLTLYNSNQCDEDPPEPIECDSDQFLCDINVFLYNSNKCDSYFDCLDQSDEMNCTIDELKCFFKCDDKCIEKLQICDGKLDCIDGTDENGCSKDDHCHFPYQIKCKDENKCYASHQTCDDFNDCFKKSDEINCQKKQNIVLNQTINSKFYVSSHCLADIPIYKYCVDSNICLNSEKKNLCDNEVNDVKFQFAAENSGILKWSYEYQTLAKFKIEIYDWDTLQMMKTYITQNKHKQITNLGICKRYLIIISLRGTFGKALQISTVDKIKSPHDIKFNETINELSWSITLFCYPYVFYVVCEEFNNTTVEIFVIDTKIILNSKLKKCSVSTCPQKKFNKLCSNVQTLLIQNNYNKKIKETLGIILLIVLIIQIIIVIKCYGQRIFDFGQQYFRGRYTNLNYEINSNNDDYFLIEDNTSNFILMS